MSPSDLIEPVLDPASKGAQDEVQEQPVVIEFTRKPHIVKFPKDVAPTKRYEYLRETGTKPPTKKFSVVVRSSDGDSDPHVCHAVDESEAVMFAIRALKIKEPHRHNFRVVEV